MSNVSRLVLEIDSSGVIKATGNLNEFARASQNAENSAKHFDDIFSRMNLSSLAAVAGVTALVGALNKIGSALGGAINTYAGFEKIEVGLSGVMKNLGSTKKASDDFLKSLKVLSNETTFGYNTLADAASQMLTVGVSSDEVKKRLIQLGNAAGGSTEKFNRLSQVYTNILATGKAGSMQLQQLSTITGTSFVNALGKTNASAEEVTAQIEKLTSKGGMLEGAMDSLIDTVEGKQGFVSDWFDEMTRNFAEASGLVDVYKGVMDILSSALETLAGWFAKISESPFGKAILSGVLAATLGVIVATIGVGLVNAIIRLNAELAITATLKAIINPAMAAVGLATAAVVGTVIGLSTAMDNAKRSAEDLKEALDKFDSSPVGVAKGQVTALENEIKASEEYIKKLEKAKADLGQKAYVEAVVNGNTEQLRQYQEQIALIDAGIKKENEIIAAKKEEKRIDEEKLSLESQFNKNKDELDKIIDSQLSSNEKALKDIQETVEKLNNIKITNDKALDTGLVKQSAYDEVALKLNDAINAAVEKERTIKLKIAAEQGDWRAIYEKTTGTKAYETGKSGAELGSETVAKIESQIEKQIEMIKKFYPTNSEKQRSEIASVYGNVAGNVRGLVEKLITSNAKDKFGFDDASIEVLTNLAQYLQANSDALAENTQNADYSGNILGALGEVGGYISTINDFMQASTKDEKEVAKGNLIGMIMSLIVKMVDTLGENFEGEDKEIFGQLKDGLGEIFSRLSVVGNSLGNVIRPALVILQSLGDTINSILMALRPLQAIIEMITQVIAIVMRVVANLLKALVTVLSPILSLLDGVVSWLDKITGGMVETNEAREDELAKLQALNDEYTKLYEAMKEQEEYYLTKKNEINAESYKLGVTPVHDMILTDKGVFSTDPKDTIMAMKRPGDLLGGGGSNVYITVNNNAGVEVRTETNTNEDGSRNIIVDISKAVAADFASGANGWESAFYAQQSRAQGKRVSI